MTKEQEVQTQLLSTKCMASLWAWDNEETSMCVHHMIVKQGILTFSIAIRTCKTHIKINWPPGFIPKIDRFKEIGLEKSEHEDVMCSFVPWSVCLLPSLQVFHWELHLSASLDWWLLDGLDKLEQKGSQIFAWRGIYQVVALLLGLQLPPVIQSFRVRSTC